MNHSSPSSVMSNEHTPFLPVGLTRIHTQCLSRILTQKYYCTPRTGSRALPGLEGDCSAPVAEHSLMQCRYVEKGRPLGAVSLAVVGFESHSPVEWRWAPRRVPTCQAPENTAMQMHRNSCPACAGHGVLLVLGGRGGIPAHPSSRLGLRPRSGTPPPRPGFLKLSSS